MAYSVLGIYNLALSNIGQPKIDSLTEDSTAANQANLVWEYVRDEVLEAADWTFAKERVALTRNGTAPEQGYLYAYTLPSDFLRLCRQREADPPVYPLDPAGYKYVIETLADGTECLFTDYDNSSVDLAIQYIRREETPTRYTSHFITTVAFRLGAALAPVLTASGTTEERQWKLYEQALNKAKGLNASGDYLEDETGSTNWVNAGRL